MLLPVYNAHQSLEASVGDILEVLPELTDRFELCILDDGSTDDTAETARELAARYPQIKLIRHPVRLGLAETIQTALDHTEGEIVLVGDDDYRLDPDDLLTLWRLREKLLAGLAQHPLAADDLRRVAGQAASLAGRREIARRGPWTTS